jgi:CRISPR-associated protein Cas2
MKTRVNRHDIVVAYDVSTETPEGRRRLREVAKICKNYGQRVQFSVFECSVTPMQLEQLQYELCDVMDPEEDSLRLYVLHLGRESSVRIHGKDRYVDFDEPLVF